MLLPSGFVCKPQRAIFYYFEMSCHPVVKDVLAYCIISVALHFLPRQSGVADNITVL